MNLESKALLLGDEAIALGAIHAGISGVYAYPGTPSTEITEYIQNSAEANDVFSKWCVNEKTAMEWPWVCRMWVRDLGLHEHVGMNVAADAFVNSAGRVSMEAWLYWWLMIHRCTLLRMSRIHASMVSSL